MRAVMRRMTKTAAAVCRMWGHKVHPWETREPRLRR